MNNNLYTNGFLLIFKIYFHNIRPTRSHVLRPGLEELNYWHVSASRPVSDRVVESCAI
jgi:hypothetical protein